MKTETSIYILLTDTGTLFTKAIKQYTDAPYNHVSIAFDEELNEVFSFGRKHPRNPLCGGFVKENLCDGTFRYFQNTKCVLFKLNVTERQLKKVKRLIRFFQSKQNAYIYNIAGLFGVMINHPIELKRAYFCSQFVADVLRKSGIQLWDKSSALVTPNEFLEHRSLKMIYQGKLYEYPSVQSKKVLLYQPKTFQHKFMAVPYGKRRL